MSKEQIDDKQTTEVTGDSRTLGDMLASVFGGAIGSLIAFCFYKLWF